MTTHASDALRHLPGLNDNYSPAKPWVCVTHTEHTCSGTVIGAIGAIPVCADGARTEVAARVADRERIAILMDTPVMRTHLAWEQAMDARYS
jgi:hypothetical protein